MVGPRSRRQGKEGPQVGAGGGKWGGEALDATHVNVL